MDPQKHSSGRGRASWARTICQIDWTCIFFIISLGIATAILQKTSAVQRPVYIGDATISYPHRDSNSIDFWVALVVPAIILLATAAALEFVVFRSRGSGQAWLMLLNIVLALLASLACTGFLTELFKRICGRLRPDYLDRCQPEVSTAGAGPIPFGTYPTITCTTADLKELRDGHFSFPSGHASCSMVIGLFGALYVLWAVHCRGNRDSLGPLSACRDGRVCMRAWLRAELLRLATILLVLLFIAWPWGVAVSRFRDNRHNVSDVVAGMLLGSFFAPLFLARLAWHSSGWEAVQQQEEEEGWQLQANPSAALPVLPAISSEINGQSNMRSVQLVNVHQ